MRTTILRHTARAASALIACLMLAACGGTGDLCEDDSFQCTCMEICYSRMESCLQSGQHDRECRLDYEACINSC
jgi:hypothetical protein